MKVTTIFSLRITACELTDGMSSSAVVPDHWITSEPQVGTPPNARPNSAQPWAVEIPAPPGELPKLVVRLVREDVMRTPIDVGKVKVTGTVSTFNVLYKNDERSTEWTPIMEDGIPKVSQYTLCQ